MTITKVGVIGAGAIGQAFSRQLARAGIETVVSNRRGPESLSAFVRDLCGKATAANVRDAAEEEVVLISVPWIQVAEVLSVMPDWEERILIDATNPVLPNFQVAELGGRTSSEIVSELAPGAQLVKAFNTLSPHLLACEPDQAGGKRVIFFSGDHVRAKGEVGRLIRRLGFAGIDLGRLVEGGKLQQFPGGPLSGLNLIKME
jgi:8-hydroxy-5-deazaflavin:NADPH oxidoreductase